MRHCDLIEVLCSLFNFHSIFGQIFVGVSESPRLVPGSYEKLWPYIVLYSLFNFHFFFGQRFVGVSEPPRLVPGSYDKLWPNIGPLQPFLFPFYFWASVRWRFWTSKICTRQLWEIVTIYRSYAAFLISIPFLGKCSLVFLNLQDLYQAVMRSCDHIWVLCSFFNFHFIVGQVFVGVSESPRLVPGSYEKLWPYIGPMQPF